jgi:hypothetical protein
MNEKEYPLSDPDWGTRIMEATFTFLQVLNDLR